VNLARDTIVSLDRKLWKKIQINIEKNLKIINTYTVSHVLCSVELERNNSCFSDRFFFDFFAFHRATNAVKKVIAKH